MTSQRHHRAKGPVRAGAALAFAIFASAALAQAAKTVTMDNFVRAETDRYFTGFVREGAFGKLTHSRELIDVNHQTVVRSNRDTLYSRGVFDLDAGPVTFVLPDAGGRFMSALVIDEDHYTSETIYTPGPHRITRDQAGARYVTLLIRTFVDPNDPLDLRKVHALQDAIRVQQASPGKFDVPHWDEGSLARVREELIRAPGFDSRKAFGAKAEVNPRDHLIGTARGWGGNPDKDAIYLTERVKVNDGKAVYQLQVKNVPVDGFWSISVYNKDGFFEPNPQNAYSLNNVTGKRAADGSYRIQFGGCGKAVPNCLPIVPAWNYTVRLYRPRAELLNGHWIFPMATPLS